MKNLVTLTVIAAVLVAGVSLADYSAPLEDDYKTMALWDMDNLQTLSDGKVIVRDQEDNFSRDSRHLELFNGPNPSTDRGGTIVPSMSGFGNALEFDGVNNWARSFNNRVPINDGFKLEFWIKLDSTKTDLNWIAEVPDVWRVYAESNQTRITMYVKDANGDWSDRLRLAITPDAWRHVTAGFEDGVAYLSVDGTTQNTTVNLPTSSMYRAGETSFVYVGMRSNGDRFLKGLLDDVRLSNPAAEPPTWATVYEDTPRGTFALYHFEEIISGKIFDDNSFGTRDPANLNVRGNPQIGVTETYPADNEDFGNSILLDGMSDYLDGSLNLDFDNSNFRVEAWVKLHPDWYTLDGVTMPIVWYGEKFRFHFESGSGSDIGPQRLRADIFNADGEFEARINNIAIGAFEGWNHVAFEFYEGTGKTFINGEERASGTASTTTVNPSTSGTVFVGGTSTTGRRLWGRMDEFRLSSAVMPELECGDFGYLPADLNRDCVVDIQDLKIFVADWLRCTADEPGCESAF